MKTVRDILAGEATGGGDAPFAGAVCDSRAVRPGVVFVAVPGVKTDGAAFAADAAAAGAACIVSETEPPGLPVPVVRVRNARRAWAILSAQEAGRPSEKMHVWGVTGTNGKTTTAWTLAAMLQPLGPAGYITTVETGWPGHYTPSEHTTPDAGELQRIFAGMSNAGVRRAAMEVSSHAASQHRIDGIRFAGGIFTNLTEDHLDYHGTMENYFDAKTEFFRRIAETSPGAPAVVFGKGGWAERMSAAVSALPLRRVSCGFGPGFDVSASDITVSAAGNTFTLARGRDSARISCPLAGEYNVANVLCAAAAALCEGATFDDVAAAIPGLQPRWGRLERVETESPADVFVDFAHTDDALANVLSAVRRFTRGKVWVVFGAGGDRDRVKRPLMGRACALNADRLVVTSDNPRSENPLEIIAQITAGIPAGTEFAVEPDRAKAIALALSSARKGDCVVIAGKGHETVQTIAGRDEPFDDRLAAASWKRP